MAKRAESRARYFIRKTAKEKGWNLNHPNRDGDVLEEQEIADYTKNTDLGLKRPDFLFCLQGEPVMVIEAKNTCDKIGDAVAQAEKYCDLLNNKHHYHVKLAVGIAGEPDNGYIVSVKFWKDGQWHDLTAKGYPLTAIPSKEECANALDADDSTTELTIPSFAEFVDAAIEISNILHAAKIETTLRPKVVGAVTTALYVGDISLASKTPLKDINTLMTQAIAGSQHFEEAKQKKLIEALTLGVNDFERLSNHIFRIVAILKRLNVKSVLQSDADFLGMFYEAFLRYGADNNAMGIVFTPRHITRMCVDLVGVEVGQKIIDMTCGTGGFLVAAFDQLKNKATTRKSHDLIRESIYGFDTNPTVWALSCLNMFFRGDGKSHIENTSSLDEASRESTGNMFQRAFLNPPFHQEGEPERDFIDASMNALVQGGLFAGVIYAGVFADDDNRNWRAEFMRKHTILALISLPDELFYPNASAITTIMIARAHEPQPFGSSIYMGRIDNDGFVKLKGKRVACEGSQIAQVTSEFAAFLKDEKSEHVIGCSINASLLRGGAEYSPQTYLPQKPLTQGDIQKLNNKTVMALFQAVTSYPDITDSINPDFNDQQRRVRFPLATTEKLSYFFDVKTGKSAGLKTYTEGIVPYVSSGDDTNGVVGLVAGSEMELCEGCISVSAFGTAYLQPWNYVARGNGGSSVRVLVPRFAMTDRELLWFIAQINSQKWRFTYARQAIKSRLCNLMITSPDHYMEERIDIADKVNNFKKHLSELATI